MKRTILLLASLLTVNGVMFALQAAEDSNSKPCYYTDMGSGTCSEVCVDYCYLCSCGGGCKDNCSKPE